MYPVTAGGMNSWMWALKSRTSQKKVLEKCLLYSTKVQISNGGKAVNSLLTATFHSKLQAGGLCWDLGVTISTWSLLGLFLARTTIQKWMLIKARCSTLKNASTLRLSFYTCTFKGAKKTPQKNNTTSVYTSLSPALSSSFFTAAVGQGSVTPKQSGFVHHRACAQFHTMPSLHLKALLRPKDSCPKSHILLCCLPGKTSQYTIFITGTFLASCFMNVLKFTIRLSPLVSSPLLPLCHCRYFFFSLPPCHFSPFSPSTQWLSDYINSLVFPVSGIVIMPLYRCHKDKFLHIHRAGSLSRGRSVLFLRYPPGSSYLPGLWDSRERHYEKTTKKPQNRQAGQRTPHQHGIRTNRFGLLSSFSTAARKPESLWQASSCEVSAIINIKGI